MFGLHKSNSRHQNCSENDEKNATKEDDSMKTATKKLMVTSPLKFNAPLAKAKRMIANRSALIQKKKRKPSALEEDTSIIHGLQNINMTAAEEEEGDTTGTPLDEPLLLPPRSCTPAVLEEKKCYWNLCHGSSSTTGAGSLITATGTPGSWSASRAPPKKSCLLSQERARINSNASKARAVAAEESSLTPPTDDSKKKFTITPAPRNSSLVVKKGCTPKTVQFGTVDAAEFDLERPAVEFTPMSSEVAQAKYSIDKKAHDAEQQEEETTEETKQNAAILAQWDAAFDDLEGEEEDHFSTTDNRRQRRSTGRRDRRSSSFFSKSSQSLIATDDDDDDTNNNAEEENDENETPQGTNSPRSTSIDITAQSSTNDEYQSPLLMNRESISTNSSDRMCTASLRTLHASGALLSPNTSGSSLSDVSTEEIGIHDIRVSLERNLDNAFSISSSSGSPSAANTTYSSSNMSSSTVLAENNEIFTWYLPSDQNAVMSILNDIKFEVNHDLETVLSNSAKRQIFQGASLLLDRSFVQKIADDFMVNEFKNRGPLSVLQEMFSFLRNECPGTCMFSVLQEIDHATSKALLDTKRIERSNVPGDRTDAVESTLESLQRDSAEWEVAVLEQLIVQLSLIENTYEQQCVKCETSIQECEKWKEANNVNTNYIGKEPRKAIRNNVPKQVEKLAKDVRVLENHIRAAETEAPLLRLINANYLQELTLYRKALSLIRSQEQSTATTELISFEPRVLAWNNVELMFPNVISGVSSCVCWSLSERPVDYSLMDVESCDSNFDTMEQVLELPVITIVPHDAIPNSSMPLYQLLMLLFGGNSNDEIKTCFMSLLEISGLLEEKRNIDLPNAVLTASEIFACIKMLEYDISETESDFNCKAVIFQLAGRKVGLQIQLNIEDHEDVRLKFWYDPKDLRSITRLLPSSVDVERLGMIDSDELCEKVQLSFKEMLESNCNSLILQNVCRSTRKLVRS